MRLKKVLSESLILTLLTNTYIFNFHTEKTNKQNKRIVGWDQWCSSRSSKTGSTCPVKYFSKLPAV